MLESVHVPTTGQIDRFENLDLISYIIMGTLYSVMAKVLDCGLKVSEFKLQLCNYIHSEKGMNPLIPPPIWIK